MDFGFKVTSQAQRDLRAIWRYIANDDLRVAYRFCDELYSAAESLQNFPHRHGNLVKRPNIRKLPYKAYLIFYKIDEETRTVEILRFWHTARNQNRLRLKEETPVYAAQA